MKANLFLLLVVLCCSRWSLAAVETFSERIEGTQVTTSGAPQLTVYDDKYYTMATSASWQTQFLNAKVTNRVRLGINPDVLQTNALSGGVTITIKSWTWDVTTSSFITGTVSKTLAVSYDLTGTNVIDELSTYTATNAHRMEITITSVNGGAGFDVNDVYLQAEIEVERYYAFGGSAPASPSATVNGQYIDFEWTQTVGAEWYELEWVHVNDYVASMLSSAMATSLLSFNFYRNSTRIIIRTPYYRIPNQLDRGYLAFRVRAIGVTGPNNDIRKEGSWTAAESGTISGLATTSQVIAIAGTTDASLNWGRQVGYTEDGKRFEGTVFADGLGRTRQSISHNTETGQAVVSNVYYDGYGRIAVSDLPTPDNNEDLSFRLNFNWADGHDHFGPDYFDQEYIHDSPTCSFESPAMSVLTGAGKYYSPSNPNQDAANKRIPDAQQYPYTRVEYMDDHTGRLRSTGGFGPDFTIGSGHATQYYYSTPTQEELDRLFGSEVGYDEHYQRRVTVDANGQAYVEYFDMAGRVIATGLAGANPHYLDALDNNTTSTLTQTITSGLNGEITPTSMTLTYPFQVFNAADFTFSYDLNPAQFTDATCLPDICFDCSYILRISVKDEVCGDVVFSNTHHINGAAYDAICNGTYPYAQDTVVHLENNSYVLTKELIVDQEAIDAYWCTYIDNNTCVPTFAELFNTGYDAADFSSCRDAAEASDEDDADPCEVGRELMLNDVSPGGQYAQYTVSGGTYTAASTISVLYTGGSPALSGDWRHPSGGYKDASGSTALIEVSLVSLGVYVPAITVSHPTLSALPLANGNYTIQPQDLLNLSDFVQLFQDSWAGALLPFHPEYCYLQFCEANSSSHDYDAAMSGITTHGAACLGGYYGPMGTTVPTMVTGSFYSSCDHTHPDPFFASGGGGSAYQTAMDDRIHGYTTIGGTNLSMLDYAILLNTCPGAADAGAISTCIRGYSGGCYDDAIWLTFRNLYQELKDSLYSVAEAAGTTACENSAIGTTSPFATSVPRWGLMTAALATDYSLPANDPYTEATTQAAAACGDICAQYADEWLAAFANCPAVTGLSPTQRTNLRLDLISLCSYGCSEEHPAGATTLPATITPSPLALLGGNLNGGATINDVLALYISEFTESDLCTELLISEPAPYKEHLEGSVYLDTCGCNLLLATNLEFTTATELPEGVRTVEDLLAYNTGLSLEDIDAMICHCQSLARSWEPGYVWTDKDAGTIASWQEVVPDELTCDDCVQCDQVSHALDQLDDRFGSEFRGSENYAVILTNYFNGQFGFDLTYNDYAEFLLKCGATEEAPVCEPTPELLSWLEVMNLMAHRGDLIAASPLDLADVNIVYPNSPLQQALQTNAYYTAGGGSSLSQYFGGSEATPPCTLSFSLPEGATFGVEDIIAFNAVYPTGGNCSEPSGTFNVEVTYLSCGQLATATLSGSTNCFPVQQCYCGGPLSLCNASTNDQFADHTPCYEPVLSQLYQLTEERYLQTVTDARAAFETDYNAHCSAAFSTESFQYTGPFNLYQYTLYYYDQAGNLVKTIAPKGMTPASGFTAIDASRNNTTGISGQAAAVVPSHTYKTEYVYNSYDQLVRTTNPDQDGATHFWYDFYGRIAASQNPLQATENKYSYTLYDAQGRPVQVGQVVKTGTFPEATVKTDDLGAGFRTWVTTSSTQSEVTITIYDEALSGIPAKFSNGLQQNLRLRVASVLYFDAFSSSTVIATDYLTAVHYSYDLHGNVIETLQDVQVHEVVAVLQDVKSTQYEFELISGNVKKVKYQPGKPDQQVHAYVYDRLNRLTEVFSSTDGEIHQSREAHYRYFDYGPLARVETGQHKVQANDYSYTINGWLKGMNSNTLTPTRDGGKDGSTGYYAGNTNAHAWVARDVTGFTMGYYAGDYRSIATTSFEAALGSGNAFSDAIKPLYNGNIAYTTTAIAGDSTQGAVYGYDQLQRLKSMVAYRSSTLTSANNWSGSAAVSDYQSSYTYDANGNLSTLFRNGNATDGLGMDNFTYHYTTVGGNASNRLDYVSDAVTSSPVVYTDIKNTQSAGNYAYDKIGELTQDSDEHISSIEWRRGDKRVKKIVRNDATSDELEFVYNPLGQRLLKIAKKRVGGVVQAQSSWTYTYYAYDANGQTMAMYTLAVGGATQTATLNEQVIYGASRIGEVSVSKLVYSSATGVPAFTDITVNKLGNKKYELTNHLGNVLAVITDRNLVTSGGTPSVYEAVVIMKSDYYPFGMEMPGRNSNTSAYRFGYNGMESDPEATGQGNSYTTEFRQYDPRLGRWMSLDPMMMSFANESPYCAFADNPVYFVDPYGLEATEDDKGKNKDKSSDSGTQTNKPVPGIGSWISQEIIRAKENIKAIDLEEVNISGKRVNLIPKNTDFVFSRDLPSVQPSSTIVRDVYKPLAPSPVLIPKITVNGKVVVPGNCALKLYFKKDNKGHLMEYTLPGQQVDRPYSPDEFSYWIDWHPRKYVTSSGITNEVDPGGRISRFTNAAIPESWLIISPMGGEKLALELASASQMAEEGFIIANTVRDAPRLVALYGGRTNEWVKMSTSAFTRAGTTIETHWYRNIVTGANVEYKTKLVMFNYLK